MNSVFLCNSEENINRVFPEELRGRTGAFNEVITESCLGRYAGVLRETEFVFSTWGMPALTSEQIKQYLPSLKAVFYAAGTVGYFALPFLENGIRVFSAAYANGIPVAEYTVSQIVLAAKGYFGAEKLYRENPSLSRKTAGNARGCYGLKVGLAGLGTIGSMVAGKLKAYDAEVFAWDPFAAEKKARELGVRLASLEEIFSNCDVVSNHLADKEELRDILSYNLFSLMKDNAAFINTGRGAQVDESGLARALRERPSLTALLDVLKDEENPEKSPLWECGNAYITPHMAGSIGGETARMGEYIVNQYEEFLRTGKCSGEVTEEKLKTMA